MDLESRADRIARSVAYVINPLILPPLLIGALLVEFGAPASETAVAVASALLLLTVLPALFLGWMVRGGRAASIEVLRQRERVLPFVFGILCAVAATGSLAILVETARPLVLAVGFSIVMNAVLLALITIRWKISIHAASVAGVASVLLFAIGWPGDQAAHPGWFLPIIPLVMWARVRTGSHSPGEVLAGAAFGLAAPYLELWALAAAGFLPFT